MFNFLFLQIFFNNPVWFIRAGLIYSYHKANGSRVIAHGVASTAALLPKKQKHIPGMGNVHVNLLESPIMKTFMISQSPATSSSIRSVAAALTFWCFLLVAQTASAAPLTCTGSPNISMEPIRSLDRDTVATAYSATSLTCPVSGLQAIHLNGILNSTMTLPSGDRGPNPVASGRIHIDWLGANGVQLIDTQTNLPMSWGSWPNLWVGTVKNEPFNRAVTVPANATQARIRLSTDSVSTAVGGTWSINNLVVSPGISVSLVRDASSPSPVAARVATATVNWTLHTVPDVAGAFTVTVTDIDGASIQTSTVPKTTGRVNIPLGPLPVGWYNVDIEFSPTSGDHKAGLFSKPFVSLPDGATPLDPRFGVDTAMSYNLIMDGFIGISLDLMKEAGVGIVRDRLSWVNVFNDCANWRTQSLSDALAQEVRDRGMEVLTLFEASPPCARYNIVTANRAPHPLNYDEVYNFGQAYARNIGTKARYIEYWNEPNAPFFWSGYPWQLASGLKAFSAGVKSVDRNIQILSPSVATNPGDFFDEVYENGSAKFVDILNYHFYGGARHRARYDMETQQGDIIDPMLNKHSLHSYPSWMTEAGFWVFRDNNGALMPSKIEQANHLVKIFAGTFGAGYERTFYFSWPEFKEGSRAIWGIALQDNLNPGYLSLALLIRHLQNATAVNVQSKTMNNPDTGGNMQVSTVFFKKPNGEIVAVSWAGREAITALHASEIRDVFGRLITNPNNIAPDDSAAYLLSGLSIPNDARPVPQRTRATSNPAQPLMLQVDKVLVDNVEQIRMVSSNVYLPAPWGSVVEVQVRARNANNNNVPGAQIVCQEGQEMILISTKQPTAGGNGIYTCRYRAQMSSTNKGYITITGTNGQAEDKAHIALSSAVADGNLNEEELTTYADGSCRTSDWRNHLKSANIDPFEVTVSPSSPCKIEVRATINDASYSTWFHPTLAMPSGLHADSASVRLELANIVGLMSLTDPATTSVFFQMAWWENNSRNLWALRLGKEDNSNVYTGNLASTGCSECPAGNILDLSKVRSVYITWSNAGVGPQMANGSYGAVINSLKIGRLPSGLAPLNVSATLSTDSVTITNNTALNGKIRSVVLAADAAESFIEAFQNSAPTSIAANAKISLPLPTDTLQPGNYIFYFFAETGDTRPYTTWTPLQTLSFTVADDGSGNGNGNGQGTALFDADIQKAYIAFFNRPADAPGMAFWMNHPPGGMQVLLAEFARSEEYLSDYRGLNHVDTLTKVYRHLFGRDPEPEGLNYWSAQMEAGWVTIANVAYEVLGGARNEDFDIIVNKVLAANAFTGALDTTEKIEAYNNAGPNGLGNEAKNWLAAVNEYTATVEAAVAKLGALLNTLVTGN